MTAQGTITVHNIKTNIDTTRRASDRLFGVGPFGVGFDGLLTWMPGIGELYSLGAGLYLLAQGGRARVPGIVMWQVSILLLFDCAITTVPIAGDLVDMAFAGHLWAAALLRRSIDRTAYISRNDDAPPLPNAAAIDAAIAENKRVVLLDR